jgi:hypothetical protein
MFWNLEGNEYIRFLNSENIIEYICNITDASGARKSAPCSQAVAEVLQREKGEDPILKKPLNNRTTGFVYGFILYNKKKGRFVFKNGTPPAVGGKTGRGKECANNSNIRPNIETLYKLGETLRKSTPPLYDMGLDEDDASLAKIHNSVRICTITNLILR